MDCSVKYSMAISYCGRLQRMHDEKVCCVHLTKKRAVTYLPRKRLRGGLQPGCQPLHTLSFQLLSLLTLLLQVTLKDRNSSRVVISQQHELMLPRTILTIRILIDALSNQDAIRHHDDRETLYGHHVSSPAAHHTCSSSHGTSVRNPACGPCCPIVFPPFQSHHLVHQRPSIHHWREG